MTDQTTDRHTCHNQKAAAGPAWQCPRCSATPAVPLSPVVQSPIREQVLNALDFSYCQTLGFGTPEGLLAAYEASRTQTVDDSAVEALSDTLYDALYAITPFAEKYFADEGEGLRGAVRAVLEQAAVLPATTNHDTTAGGFELRGDTEIRAAALREAADWYAQQGKTVLAAAQVAADLRRRADAESPPTCGADGCSAPAGHYTGCPEARADETAATATGCWCGHPEDRHWTGATDMTFPDGCHDCRGWNGAHVYGQELPWLPEGDEPAAGARQDGAQR